MITAVVMATAFTGCKDNSDNPVTGPDTSVARNYSERMVPVIDPKGASQGTAMRA